MFNPFPGLRPFEPDESHLFFGREKEIDDLLRRLRSSRFVAVVGTSGSGKSSLVRSGLIPSLQSGFMAGAGSSWRIAMLRPGEDPVGHLAAALDSPEVLRHDPSLADTNRVLIEVTLRRSTLGLVETVRQAHLPSDDNVLVIVDQFEELFRFSESVDIVNSRDEAIAFVRLLLEATAQSEAPIYVVLTMRSDFIGDCMNFPGLPEAVNAGLYLVGRMPREGLRAAITGPVAVAGGTIAPRLVHRVLNDLGDDQDLLPLVQHALMRTWDHWARSGPRDEPIDVQDYEAAGTFRNALSRHVEEAYEEACGLGHAETTERVFKALTDAFADPRGVRRPTSVAELAAITEASEADVINTVNIFRRHGRSFLTPPATVPLAGRTVVDLSHESLMRCWDRLITWTEEERAAAAFYLRLSQAAAWFEEGAAGLWRNPELELAQRWTVENEPTAAWARRYAPGFERAMAFLDRSLNERDRQNAELERERRAKLRRTQYVAAGLATGLMVAIGLGMFAWNERRRARENLALARTAVDESLAAVERDPSQMAFDPPQVTELRRELLSKAERFYRAFMDQEPRSEEMRRDLATAHLRLAHINRLLEKSQDAEREYREAIAGFSALVTANPVSEVDRAALGSAYNWLGETLRPQLGRSAEAASAYERARQIQQALVKDVPGQARYQEDLARTLSNRGILRYNARDFEAAEADFRESIRLLETLTGSTRAIQDLGRVANNLGGVLEERRGDDARSFYERAVASHSQLVAKYPDNREYKQELVTFTNNLAMFLHDSGDIDPAKEMSLRAVELITELTRPTPSLAIERADSHNLSGVILQTHGTEDAMQAFANALGQFGELQKDPIALHMRKFHERFGDLLVNLALFAGGPAGDARGRALLARAVDQYSDIARQIAETGTASQMRAVLDTLGRVIPQLGESSRRSFLDEVQDQLRRALDARGPS